MWRDKNQSRDQREKSEGEIQEMWRDKSEEKPDRKIRRENPRDKKKPEEFEIKTLIWRGEFVISFVKSTKRHAIYYKFNMCLYFIIIK